MRAIRNDDAYDDYDDYDNPPSRAAAPRRERRLAWDIALGIWLGGMALATTAGIGWLVAKVFAMTTIQFGG